MSSSSAPAVDPGAPGALGNPGLPPVFCNICFDLPGPHLVVPAVTIPTPSPAISRVGGCQRSSQEFPDLRFSHLNPVPAQFWGENRIWALVLLHISLAGTAGRLCWWSPLPWDTPGSWDAGWVTIVKFGLVMVASVGWVTVANTEQRMVSSAG